MTIIMIIRIKTRIMVMKKIFKAFRGKYLRKVIQTDNNNTTPHTSKSVFMVHHEVDIFLEDSLNKETSEEGTWVT